MRKTTADSKVRFCNPQTAIGATIKNWTTEVRATNVKNLGRLDAVLKWHTLPANRRSLVRDLNELIVKLKATPDDVREFICALVQRAHRARETNAVVTLESRGLAIVSTDVEAALRLSEAEVMRFGEQLEHYRLGCVGHVFFDEEEKKWSVYLNSVGGWAFWTDLGSFCEKAPMDIRTIVMDLDFARLDAEPPVATTGPTP